MKKAIKVHLGILMSTTIAVAAGPELKTADYDRFYSQVILKAGNGTKQEWLASYQPVVQFIERVRQDVERLPSERQMQLARAAHDNGYWKGQKKRVLDPADPFLGAKFRSDDAALRRLLTPAGYSAWQGRYSHAPGSHRLSIEAVADRAGLYKSEGKQITRPESIPANTYILNTNAQSWDDLLADAKNYEDPAERRKVILNNQKNAIASAMALLHLSKPLSDSEMDYAVAVIWRYTGHYFGEDGWDRELLIRTPYAELPEAEKAKDRDVWRALREVLQQR